MARTPSTMLPIGTPLPTQVLPVLHQTAINASKPLLVAFLCNHCPFVLHILPVFTGLALHWHRNGLEILAVSSNDPAQYPEDGPEQMAALHTSLQWTFPYWFDATQDLARSFQAACTPDFYLFDAQGVLVYRGCFDASRPGNGIPVSGNDLNGAVQAVLNGTPVPAVQQPSLGCSIKWKPGTAPAYATRL